MVSEHPPWSSEVLGIGGEFVGGVPILSGHKVVTAANSSMIVVWVMMALYLAS